MDRVVLDPSVLISAVISPTGAPAMLWKAVVDGRFEMVICPHLLAELGEVLERPKFRRNVSLGDARDFVRLVARRGYPVPDPTGVTRMSRDPDDDYLLALASTEGVVALISGDLDLTEMTDHDPPILTPAEAVAGLL